MYRNTMGRRRSGMFRFVWFLVWSLALSLTSSYAYTTYSDATLQGTTIVAWAVTDVTNYQYEHWAEVQVSLTSPDGRSVSSSNVVDLNSARAQVSLPWDEDDLGNYSLRSWHTATCSEMGTFIDNVLDLKILKFGISESCYHLNPTSPGGANDVYNYIVDSPCLVECARPATTYKTKLGVPPPNLKVFRPFLEVGNFLVCFPGKKIPWLPNPWISCTCRYTF